MRLLCLSTLGGAYSLELFGQLPPPAVFFMCAGVGLACCGWRFMAPLGCFLLGFAVMGLSAERMLNNKLDPQRVGMATVFTARIDSFPVSGDASVRFFVRPRDRPDLPRRVRLTWLEPRVVPDLGETWRFTARLKRPRGNANPGGFDLEGWLFREQTGAIGYVDNAAHSYRIHGEAALLLTSARVRIVRRMQSLLPEGSASAALMAVGAGARHAISTADWDLYARTGTSHLMAISGLHIGLAAGSAYLLSWGLLALVGKRGNIRDAALIAAIATAAIYAAVAGLAVPARRALLMAGAGGLAVLTRRRVSASHLVAAPCLAVFATDPLAILTPGFKLSFAAVAILIAISQQHIRPVVRVGNPVGSATSGIKRLCNMQFALLVALFPLTALIFSRFAPLAPVANMLILPVFNFLTVPLTLVGTTLEYAFAAQGDHLLRAAHGSVEYVVRLLHALDQIPYMDQQLRLLSGPIVLVALLPALHVLLPVGWPGRKLALLALCAVLGYRPAATPRGCLDYFVLDVGQGLSVFVRTSDYMLLFDTGPMFATGNSAAEFVVLPFLRGLGVARLDRLIVSHADLDHAGGIQPVLATLPVRQVMTGEEIADINARQTRCVAGISWRVDGAVYSILHPRQRAPWTRNNSSCVLEITIGAHRLLLSGDIEAPVEKLLVYRQSIRRSTALIVPHHGSRTSSTLPFVQAVRPLTAIVAAGFGNRWGFPKPDVIFRWESVGATLLNTATSGSVSQRLCAGAQPGVVYRERLESRKYWHDIP
ncbi:MAG: DNA internalization-related competence protein ComEC/Rec2 [Woeseiaceae bacterium]